MRSGIRTVFVAAAAAAAGAWFATAMPSLSGQAPAAYRASRLPDGKPDLNGVWQALNEANFDLEAHGARPAMAVRPGPYGLVFVALVLVLGAVGAVPSGFGVVDGGSILYFFDVLK